MNAEHVVRRDQRTAAGSARGRRSRRLFIYEPSWLKRPSVHGEKPALLANVPLSNGHRAPATSLNEAYYAALRASQERWHERAHDPWPWLTYLTATIADAYADFEERISSAAPVSGRRKQDVTREHILGLPAGATFRFPDLRRELPGISDATIRLALYGLRGDGAVSADGTGRSTRWHRNR